MVTAMTAAVVAVRPDRTEPRVSPASTAPDRPGAAAAPVTPATRQSTPAGPVTDRPPGPDARPVRLSIPAIGVSAPIGPVGVKDGYLDVFDDAANVGWYGLGPVPGRAGSSVLAAHVDHARYGPGVFFRLAKLKVGATITVGFDDGSSLRFRVTERAQYPKDELPVRVLFTRTGNPVLTLITCGGAFDRQRRSYADNVVVLARPEPAAPGVGPGN
jgi:sortase (surface protein transpeptidase)